MWHLSMPGYLFGLQARHFAGILGAVGSCAYVSPAGLLLRYCVNQGLGITSMKPMPWLARFWSLRTEAAMMFAFVTTRTYRPAAMACRTSQVPVMRCIRSLCE